MNRGPFAEIDLKTIAHNFKIVKNITRGRAIIAVVKARAYGHGSVEVSKRLLKEGASCLAVAYTSEAVELRQAGLKAPIIVLFDKHDMQDYFKYGLIPVIHDTKTAKAFSREAKKRKCGLNVHVKVDTGMGRLGFAPRDIIKSINTIAKMDFIKITGLMSHFSDADLSDRSYALMQLAVFSDVRNSFILKGIKPLTCHTANSAAVMSLPDSYFDAVRPGLMLYGYSPMQLSAVSSVASRNDHQPSAKLKPAMTVKTNILSLRKLKKGTPVSYGRTFITVRDSLIAVLPIGYADGYSRAFSNNADILVRGKRAPVVGRVCMDTIMADVTDIRGVAEDDEVILLGKQKDNNITAAELAVKAGAIPYEILTSLGNGSRKVYT